MCFDVNNPYFRNKVLTASPEELRLLLIEGCIRFLRSGREGLEQKNFEKVFESFTNARNILVELMSSLRHEIAPDVCGNLESIYTYVFNRITEGSFEKDPAKIDEAIGLMEYDRETWILLMEKLATQRQGASRPAASQREPAHAGEAPVRAALSVQG